MKHSEFIEEIKDFINIYCFDYFHSIDYVLNEIEDEHQLKATVRLYDNYGHNWEIPVGLTSDGNFCIIANEELNYFLEPTDAGLYCFLWHKAMERITDGN